MKQTGSKLTGTEIMSLSVQVQEKNQVLYQNSERKNEQKMSRILQSELIGRRLTKRWYINEPYPPYPIVNQLAHELNDKQKMRLFCKYDEVWMEPKIKSNWIWKTRSVSSNFVSIWNCIIDALSESLLPYYCWVANWTNTHTHTHRDPPETNLFKGSVLYQNITIWTVNSIILGGGCVWCHAVYHAVLDFGNIKSSWKCGDSDWLKCETSFKNSIITLPPTPLHADGCNFVTIWFIRA